MSLQTIIACVVGCISILGSAVTAVAMVLQMRANITRLEGADAKRVTKEEEIDKQVVDMLVTLKEFMAAQTQVNTRVSSMLEAQVDTNAKVSEVLVDLIGRIRSMEKSTVESGQIVSLLTEVLRKQRVIGGATE